MKTEQRKYTGTTNGKNHADIRCPFCELQSKVSISAIKNGGVSCHCGAVFKVKGIAEKVA